MCMYAYICTVTFTYMYFYVHGVYENMFFLTYPAPAPAMGYFGYFE